jgi:shikimate dehydrogenase
VAEPSRRAAVLGRPIAHSLSPALHRAAYAALGIDWAYTAIDCGADELSGVLAERNDWAGFSCTMPLKRVALDAADEVDALAAAVGAANTLLPRTAGGWVAHNTDVHGVVESVQRDGAMPRSATVLGAGGTAQAVVVALAQIGLRSCSALVRDPERTKQLRDTARRAGVDVTIEPLAVDATSLAADLVISTLPREAADPFAGFSWRDGQTVLDVVYDPWPTVLAERAAACGATVRSGALMLLHQAAAQVELMTGRIAPVESMRVALRAARPGCGV